MSKPYQAFFFDFDGVLVDSVEVKTRAFAKLFEPYGQDVVKMVVEHHRSNGAMTRVEKFRWYYARFLKLPLTDSALQNLCNQFAALAVNEVVAAPEIPGAEDFLMEYHNDIPCFVVSATPHEEINQIVKRRGWKKYFREIHGAPYSKQEIIRILIKRYTLDPSHCLFFGDAEGDFRAAIGCGVHFLGIASDLESPLLKAIPEVSWRKDFCEIRLSQV